MQDDVKESVPDPKKVGHPSQADDMPPPQWGATFAVVVGALLLLLPVVIWIAIAILGLK